MPPEAGEGVLRVLLIEDDDCPGELAVKTMMGKRIQHLGVTNGGGIVGIVSSKDLFLSD